MNLAPSNSTNASTITAFLAAFIIWWLGRRNIFFPAGFEALLGGFLAAVAGYLPKDGRRVK